jgi:hypothetical protein
MPTHFDVATADARLSGALVTADTETGRATAIERICVPVDLAAAGRDKETSAETATTDTDDPEDPVP